MLLYWCERVSLKTSSNERPTTSPSQSSFLAKLHSNSDDLLSVYNRASFKYTFYNISFRCLHSYNWSLLIKNNIGLLTVYFVLVILRCLQHSFSHAPVTHKMFLFHQIMFDALHIPFVLFVSPTFLMMLHHFLVSNQITYNFLKLSGWMSG